MILNDNFSVFEDKIHHTNDIKKSLTWHIQPKWIINGIIIHHKNNIKLFALVGHYIEE